MATLEELYEQQSQIAAEIEIEKKRRQKAVIKAVQDLIDEYHLEVKNFKWGNDAVKTKKQATPKFKIGEFYWSGRGLVPTKVKEVMKNENLTLEQVKEKYKI